LVVIVQENDVPRRYLYGLALGYLSLGYMLTYASALILGTPSWTRLCGNSPLPSVWEILWMSLTSFFWWRLPSLLAILLASPLLLNRQGVPMSRFVLAVALVALVSDLAWSWSNEAPGFERYRTGIGRIADRVLWLSISMLAACGASAVAYRALYRLERSRAEG
jgi:hypothetical protein